MQYILAISIAFATLFLLLILSKKDKQIADFFLAFMHAEKPYLNPELSLHKLAEATEIPSSKLSKIINHYGKVNFYDFVNINASQWD